MVVRVPTWVVIFSSNGYSHRTQIINLFTYQPTLDSQLNSNGKYDSNSAEFGEHNSHITLCTLEAYHDGSDEWEDPKTFNVKGGGLAGIPHQNDLTGEVMIIIRSMYYPDRVLKASDYDKIYFNAKPVSSVFGEEHYYDDLTVIDTGFISQAINNLDSFTEEYLTSGSGSICRLLCYERDSSGEDANYVIKNIKNQQIMATIIMIRF